MKASVTQRWKRILMLFLLVFSLTALVGLVSACQGSKKASTYGVTDPSKAAVVVTNATTDFWISDVILESADGSEISVMEERFKKIGKYELRPGQEASLEIQPGEYDITFVWNSPKVAGPVVLSDIIERTFSASAGEAVQFRLEGGKVPAQQAALLIEYEPPTLLGGKPNN